MSEPLPCPHCGGPAVRIPYQHDRRRFSYGCASPSCNFTYEQDEELDAIAAWNRRAEFSGYRAREAEVGHRVLVCGSRNARDHRPVWEALDKLRPVPDLIIQGGATGVDTMAAEWAGTHAIPCATFDASDALWNKVGKAAGGLRNSWMLRFGQPALVVAFPGGTGTANMIQKARAAGVPIIEPCAALRGDAEKGG